MARPRFRSYPNNGTITIANGETYPINVVGNFINVKSADQAFTIRLDGTEELRAEQNRRFKLTEDDSFSVVEVVNDSGANLTFQIEVGFGSVESDDVSISGTVNVEIQAHSGLSTTADDSIAATTTEQVLASNANRKEAIIGNLASNSDVVRVGDNNTGAGRGIELSPGQFLTLETTAAIYVYNAHSSAQSVCILEVE